MNLNTHLLETNSMVLVHDDFAFGSNILGYVGRFIRFFSKIYRINVELNNSKTNCLKIKPNLEVLFQNCKILYQKKLQLMPKTNLDFNCYDLVFHSKI